MLDDDKLPTKQDKELVALLKECSKQAFEELYIRYKDKLLRFCKRTMKDEMKVEDIVQDVFLQILETHESLIPELSFYAYLQTIAQNKILDEFKKSNVRLRYVQHTLLHVNEATNQTENQIIDNNYTKLLNELIDGLTPQQKKIIHLSRIQRLSYNEIAELLQLSLRTVQKHASLALENIKKQLMEHADIHLKKTITYLIILRFFTFFLL